MNRNDPASTLTRSERLRLFAAAACATAAALLALLPRDWIERAFGVDPDAGSGFFEVLAIGVLALAAAVLASRVVRARYAGAARGSR